MGAQFTNSGYALTVRGLAPGRYELVVAARSTVTGTVNQTRSVTVTLTANPQMWVDTPAWGAHLNQSFTVAGWAIDYAAASGTGVDAVHVWAYPASGAPAIFWGPATLGGWRGDVAAAYGSQFGSSGYHLAVSGVSPGGYPSANLCG